MIKDGYLKVEEAGYLYLSEKILTLHQRKLPIMLISLIISMVSMVVLLGVKIYYNVLIWPSIIFIFLGLFSLLIINYLPKFFEIISYSYPMKIKIGCRVLGGVEALPVSINLTHGPLSASIASYVKKRKLNAKEQESYEVLSKEWDGTYKELMGVILSLNKQNPA